MVDTTWRVLVVDDSPVTERIVESILRQCGFTTVETAIGGTSALNIMRERRIDLVLCDWQMPVMDGVSVLRQVRQDPNLKHTRFFLMSASKNDRWTRLAIDAEADGLLLKPFSASELKEKLAKLPIVVHH
jgi:two-component system, chemotaxis family, chemotaxis protein CheY